MKELYESKIIESYEDENIPGFWYLELECGHKTTSKFQNSGSIFCSTCYCNEDKYHTKDWKDQMIQDQGLDQ